MKKILHQDSLTGNIQGGLKREYRRSRGTNQRWLQQHSVMKEDGEVTWNVGRAGKGKYESQRTKIRNECMPRTLGNSPRLSEDGSSAMEAQWYSRSKARREAALAGISRDLCVTL